MDNIFWMAMALLAGSLLPLLGAFNAKLGAAIASPLHASLISFSVGTFAMAAYVFATRQSVTWAGIGSACLCNRAHAFVVNIGLHSGGRIEHRLDAAGQNVGHRRARATIWHMSANEAGR